jgi:hypothetical protein
MNCTFGLIMASQRSKIYGSIYAFLLKDELTIVPSLLSPSPSKPYDHIQHSVHMQNCSFSRIYDEFRQILNIKTRHLLFAKIKQEK